MGPNCQILTGGGGLGLIVKRGYEGGQEERQNEARQQLAASNHDEGWQPATEQTDVKATYIPPAAAWLLFLTARARAEVVSPRKRSEVPFAFYANPPQSLRVVLHDMTWA